MYGGLFVLDKSFDVFQSRTLILEENDAFRNHSLSPKNRNSGDRIV